MRNIRIISVGATRDSYIKDGCSIYQKRLKRYCRFSEEIVKEVGYSKKSMNACHQEEEERLSKKLSPNHLTILCDEKGKDLSSEELAGYFQKWSNGGYSHFDFLIGGAYGVTPAIKKRADFVLRLSKMTFTHQMVRLVLIEQIYRSFTIINGENYHH